MNETVKRSAIDVAVLLGVLFLLGLTAMSTWTFVRVANLCRVAPQVCWGAPSGK